MDFIVKSFDELSTHELYQLLQLRSEVFVVEQDCAYQDVDGKDQIALHLMGIEGDNLFAYTRIFPPGAYMDSACVGRVVVKESKRGKSLGIQLMKVAIDTIHENYNTSEIALSAQTYLKKFYSDLGFTPVGEEYLEDGIPHILMVKTT
ncbi:GNAT family N-acetyltransferase [Lentiprolixibacter aurantiacus]|uniref:GNAT family N-acetyltransferase n=1 Tax=Lentiprolixibacter aurantiacus TaxID=2993939 RepID=A0AAE3SNI2_9FLAO|nr:GNAT family N-acetyltransferase [Lentiprolixibacter aurantiacus]MCX2718502.1 GNAT family N-acetyltransferase [Lentiprolixibacter aurantiacus]